MGYSSPTHFGEDLSHKDKLKTTEMWDLKYNRIKRTVRNGVGLPPILSPLCTLSRRGRYSLRGEFERGRGNRTAEATPFFIP